ncbi:MAG: PAS domain S-box protein, partial [Mariniphaga sp.]
MKKVQADDIGRKDEELLVTASAKANCQLPEDQLIKLVQEMEVLQVELELQNAELANAKVLEEINSAKYRDLFDDAPTGYLTLDRDGTITEANRAGAKLLGRDRNKLKFSQFRFFVSDVSKETFNLFFEKLWSDYKKETCEIILSENQEESVKVRVDGVVVDNGSHCLITLIDITERINAENELRKEVDRTKLLLDLFTKAPFLTDNELYGEILDIAVKVTGSKIGFLHKISDDQQEILSTTLNGEAEKNGIFVSEEHYPLDKAGSWADCVKSKEPVVENDDHNSSNRNGLPEGHSSVHRTLAIPLVQDEKVHLIVGVGNKPIDYTSSDIVQIQYVVNELYRILEKRRVENALRESERNAQQSNQHLRSILESPHGVIIFSLDRNYCYTAFTISHQEVIKLIWGITIEIGMNILEVISSEADRAKAKSNFDRVFQGENFILDEEYGDADLFRTFWENRYSPIYSDLLEITGLTVFVTEITERRRAEQELRNSEEKYRNIFENVYDAYYEANIDGTIVEISPSIETISKGQYKRNELIGKSIADFYASPEERDLFYSELTKFGRVTDFELSLLNRDGFVVPISISSGLMNNAAGRPVIIGSIRDITERKKTEKLIAKNNKDLQFLNSFAFNLSRLPSSDTLPGFLLQQLKRYTDATIVAYSEYDIHNQVLVTKIIEAEKEILNLIVEVAGSDLLNLESPVSDEIYQTLVAHNINKHETFFEASFGAVPIEADSKFREKSRIKNIYGIALTIGVELYGTLLLCFADDVDDSSEELMQSFANLSAVALRRKKAEDDLKTGYDQLEQKVIERTLELNKVNAFIKAIVNNAGVTVISTTNTGNIVSFNPAAEQMLGYSQDEVVGKYSILQFFELDEIYRKAKEYGIFNNEEGTLDFETYIDYVIEKRPDTFEWEMVRKDGTLVPVLLSLDWLKGSDGWNTGYVGVATDITLRKQTEDALRISEKNLSQITDSVPIFIALLNKNLEYIFINKAYQRFLNLAKSEILGKNVSEIVGDKVFERAYPFLLSALNGDTNTVEIRLPRANNQERIVLETYLPYYQGDAICGVLATIIDVTERIHSEQLLNKKVVENLAILKAVPDLIFKIDKYGKFLSFQLGENIPLYVTPDQFIGMKIEDVMPPNISSLALDAMSKALQTKELVSFEYELPIHNELRFFEDRVLTIDDEEILMIIRDITDRKITEKALSWNESLLKKVTESSPLGFLVVDNRTDEIL